MNEIDGNMAALIINYLNLFNVNILNIILAFLHARKLEVNLFSNWLDILIILAFLVGLRIEYHRV